MKSLGIIPLLYVRPHIISITPRTTKIYASIISIKLQEKATIKRNNQLVYLVSVWDEGVLAVYNTKEDTLKGINKSLNIIIDIFLNDYLAVNPKK